MLLASLTAAAVLLLILLQSANPLIYRTISSANNFEKIEHTTLTASYLLYNTIQYRAAAVVVVDTVAAVADADADVHCLFFSTMKHQIHHTLLLLLLLLLLLIIIKKHRRHHHHHHIPMHTVVDNNVSMTTITAAAVAAVAAHAVARTFLAMLVEETAEQNSLVLVF